MTNKPEITEYGARLVANSITKADTGEFSASVLLEALALNLGMDQYDNPGEATLFTPQMHEDTEGGLLPGDKVMVLRHGWMLDGKVIKRAQVRKWAD